MAVTSTEAIIEMTPLGMRALFKNGSGIELGLRVCLERSREEWSEA